VKSSSETLTARINALGHTDVGAAGAQQALEALTRQHQLLRDHDAHGSSARMVVGPPAGLNTVSVPAGACRSPVTGATRMRRSSVRITAFTGRAGG